MAEFELIIGNKNYSSWSLRPWLILRKLGVEFSEHRILLYRPETAAELANYCPAGRVPVLKHGDLTVWDSLAIAEYLAELFPDRHLWPETRELRAWARSACAEMHSSFSALRNELPMNCRRPATTLKLSAEAEADVHRIQQIWRQTRARQQNKGDWLCGHFSILDAFFAPVVFRFHNYAVPLDAEAASYCDYALADSDIQTWLAAAVAEKEIIAASERR